MWERVRRWWASLSGSQQFLIGAGVPTVAVAAAVGNLRDRPEAPADEEPEDDGAPSGPRAPLNPATDNIDLIIALNRMRSSLVDAFEEALDRMPDPEPEPDPKPPPKEPPKPKPPKPPESDTGELIGVGPGDKSDRAGESP